MYPLFNNNRTFISVKSMNVSPRSKMITCITYIQLHEIHFIELGIFNALKP